jgi:hypothetical protein
LPRLLPRPESTPRLQVAPVVVVHELIGDHIRCAKVPLFKMDRLLAAIFLSEFYKITDKSASFSRRDAKTVMTEADKLKHPDAGRQSQTNLSRRVHPPPATVAKERADTGVLPATETHGRVERQGFFFEPLVLYANRITGDVAAAEDIAVDALVKAIDRRDHFSVLPKLKSFLYQVVHKASINHVTSDQRHRRIQTNIAYQQQYEPASDAVIEIEVLRAEVQQEIYAEIDNLPGCCG